MNDVLNTLVSHVETVFLSDPINSGIAVLIAIIAGIVMTGYGSIIYVTIGALIAYAVALFAKGVFYDGLAADAMLTSYKDTFLGMTVAQFLVYFLAFLVVISVVYVLRLLFRR